MLGDRPWKFNRVGSLKAWQEFVKCFAAGQRLITFLLAAAFAAMMLGRLRIQPFVVLLIGDTSIGKSSAATLAGSVFGGDPAKTTTWVC